MNEKKKLKRPSKKAKVGLVLMIGGAVGVVIFMILTHPDLNILDTSFFYYMTVIFYIIMGTGCILLYFFDRPKKE